MGDFWWVVDIILTLLNVCVIVSVLSISVLTITGGYNV